MRRSPVRSRSRPPNYFALRKPDAPSGFRRYETGRVGLYSSEFRRAWDSRAVGRRFHPEAQRKRSSPAAVLHPDGRHTELRFLQRLSKLPLSTACCVESITYPRMRGAFLRSSAFVQPSCTRRRSVRGSPSFGPKFSLIKVDRCLQYIIDRSLLLGLWEL